MRFVSSDEAEDAAAFNVPRAVRVLLGPDGVPQAVARRHWRRATPVAQVQAHWEVEDEWWRDRPTQRRYFDLVLVDGTLLTVFEDLLEGAWYEQRDPDDAVEATE